MSDFNTLWKNTKVNKVEDGVHHVKIHNIDLKPTKKDPEKQMFAWDLLLPDNRHFYHNRVLTNETSLYYAKQDFLNAGLPEEIVDDLDELKLWFAKLVGSTIEISIKTNGEFQNATIINLIEAFDQEDFVF